MLPSSWMDSVVDRSPLDSESQSLSFGGGLELAAAHMMCLIIMSPRSLVLSGAFELELVSF